MMMVLPRDAADEPSDLGIWRTDIVNLCGHARAKGPQIKTGGPERPAGKRPVETGKSRGYVVGCGFSIFFCLIALTLSTRSSAILVSAARASAVVSMSAFWR